MKILQTLVSEISSEVMEIYCFDDKHIKIPQIDFNLFRVYE